MLIKVLVMVICQIHGYGKKKPAATTLWGAIFPDGIINTMAFITPVVEYWLKQEK